MIQVRPYTTEVIEPIDHCIRREEVADVEILQSYPSILNIHLKSNVSTVEGDAIVSCLREIETLEMVIIRLIE